MFVCVVILDFEKNHLFLSIRYIIPPFDRHFSENLGLLYVAQSNKFYISSLRAGNRS